jgi:predicted ribosomally synthesized peptide with nif11-like leader
MQTQHAHELVQQLYHNAELRSRLASAPTPEARKRIITEAGFGDVTADDLRALSADEFGERKVLGSLGELSDAELESVSGGETAAWFLAGIALGILI